MKIYYNTFKSSIGEILATKTEKGLSFISFPKNTWEKFLSALNKDRSIDLIKNGNKFSSLDKSFKAYFSGRKVNFREKLDLTGGTDFQKRVWKAMLQIPYGETRSYGWLAQKAGGRNKARAAGTACGANPIPIVIPCHRVIKSDKTIGGYSGGLGFKKKLLQIEGVKI
ncbi:MAG: methylated-DNA--[protein]-cysteine S-methyltransferase [Candidatus Zixiibacteriota bacterium]